MKKRAVFLSVSLLLGWVNMSSAQTVTTTAIFAGGCFWCMQPPFDALKGVVSTVVGYTGGKTENPSYDNISSGLTGHLEAIEVTYDPRAVTYEQLLDVFWRQIDPTQVNGQFADQGTQYASAIFYRDATEKAAAEKSKKALVDSNLFDKPIVTAILPVQRFWPAEEYHQKYYQKKTFHYNLYKKGSGRQDFIEKTWGAPKKQ